MDTPLSESKTVGEKLTELSYGIKDLAARQAEMKADNTAKHADLKLEFLTAKQELKQELKTEISEIKNNFVPRIEFTPVKLITYTIVGIVGGSALVAMVKSVFQAIDK